jgi:DNA processing protein
LITADCALEQGRDVFAVPGNVLTGRNAGAHGLLGEGAKIVETADDILDELHGRPSTARSGAGWPPGGCAGGLDPVLRYMEAGETYELDDLARESGLAAAVLLPRLLELELTGRVRREGARFVRAGPTVVT